MIRTRFAPSPTGYLHIGGVRTALFNWLFARQHGGQFILRIDDTDQQRNVTEALQPILDGFRWLGIDWDEGPDVGGPYGPYFQSQRQTRHEAAVKQLLDSGHAYRDYALPEELQAEREAAEAAKRPFTYSRRWMAQTEADAARWEADGRAAVVRLKMPRTGSCRFHDQIRGDVEFQWSQEQDHVIQRADGTCLYHLANVVDDHDFAITHVIRAVEHLSNTPRQVFIAQSLGYELPQYAHLPYVAEPGSANKLSKRKLDKYLKHPDFKKLYEHGLRIARAIGHATTGETFNPVIVDFYRTVGYLPSALVNYLLLLGWSLDDKTEQFTRAEMIEHFTLERVNKSPASFDPLKLWAFQQREMVALPLDQKVPLLVPFVRQAGWGAALRPAELDDRVRQIAGAAGDRIKAAGDILDYPEFFCADEQLVMEPKDVEKRLRKPGAAELLRRFRDMLAELEPFDAATVEALLRSFLEREQIQIGEIIHALRVATTGKSVGLGMFDALAILGRQSTVQRIDRALQLL
ncbi:MAG: glutamate--tRNA ligase [Planctomycetaceae bacterium]|nr:glutamate--tRNA ligase [Planctomycetaceae bacterium]